VFFEQPYCATDQLGERRLLQITLETISSRKISSTFG
jgi:hypothetical protein